MVPLPTKKNLGIRHPQSLVFHQLSCFHLLNQAKNVRLNHHEFPLNPISPVISSDSLSKSGITLMSLHPVNNYYATEQIVHIFDSIYNIRLNVIQDKVDIIGAKITLSVVEHGLLY